MLGCTPMHKVHSAQINYAPVSVSMPTTVLLADGSTVPHSASMPALQADWSTWSTMEQLRLASTLFAQRRKILGRQRCATA